VSFDLIFNFRYFGLMLKIDDHPVQSFIFLMECGNFRIFVLAENLMPKLFKHAFVFQEVPILHLNKD